jgi:hypothetical protein
VHRLRATTLLRQYIADQTQSQGFLAIFILKNKELAIVHFLINLTLPANPSAVQHFSPSSYTELSTANVDK